MTTIIFSLILFAIFLVLGGFHFYWFFGGVWGLESVIPSKSEELNSIAIPKFATLIVALVLTSFGIIYLIKSGMVTLNIPDWISNYAYWIIPSIFIIRAIGDFNFVGFFKKINHTKFAKADSKLFSPLCLGIGIMGILIKLL